jgi:hypothetical protein
MASLLPVGLCPFDRLQWADISLSVIETPKIDLTAYIANYKGILGLRNKVLDYTD